MRRTLLITLEFPPQFGGVATVYEQLGHAASSQQLLVLAPAHPNAVEYDNNTSTSILRDQLLNTIAAGGWSGRRALRQLVRKLPAIIAEHKIEALLIGNILPLGTAAVFLRRKSKIPFAVYCHGMDVLVSQVSWRKRWWTKHILQSAAAVLVNSQYTANLTITAGARPGTVHLASPLPTQTRQPVSADTIARLRKSLGENKRVVLSVGRLVPRKGVDAMIAALPIIRQTVPDLMYVVVGGGPDRERLEKVAAEHHQTDAVRFIGPVAANELAAYYELCEIFVMLSRQIGPDVEGFGIVALDAGVYGKPVIAGDSGGVREAVIDGTTGIVVPPTDSTAIAQAILKLLNDSSRARTLGANGEQRARQLQTDGHLTDVLERMF